MKKMMVGFKRNKTFAILSIILTITFVLGCLFIAFLSTENKKLVFDSVNDFVNTIKDTKNNNFNVFLRSINNNLLINLIVWLIGISIIGIPIIIITLGFKSFVLGFTYVSFIYNFKFRGILWGIIYLLPHIINLLCLFILAYYAINFSVMVFNYYFRKKEYSKNIVVKRYVKLLLINILISIISSLAEAFLIPIILRFIM